MFCACFYKSIDYPRAQTVGRYALGDYKVVFLCVGKP